MPNGLTILDVRDRISKARSVTVLTGAGISADSGVPTFRGPEGLWKNYRPEELASPEAFARDPKLVWEWYNWRRELVGTKHPNVAHETLVELERRIEHFWLITQNVDGLHALAGSQRLSEIHGNMWKVRCTQCKRISPNRDRPLVYPPTCTDCSGLLRPHIVWFGESLDQEDMNRSYQALRTCDILLIIGTSGVVYPAASFASIAKEGGALVVELNLDPTPNSSVVDVAFQGRAKDLVPLLREVT
ncbi:SIR2 family NAD-dependent protein deacylase [Nitrospira sp. T9]|uniref:SIR2 family NAD-dependent protein deacylase n=1 Tax=unclassified Nitrospira TaxID=2652172 RepID=UPI003F95E668